MSKPDRNNMFARLRRIPVDLLLALINATAILVIVAAVLALVAMVRIDHFAGRIVTTITEAVLAKIDLPSKPVLSNLRNLTDEVRTLGNTLREIKTRENKPVQLEIDRLKEALTTLNASVDRLANTRTILTDEAIGQLGRAVTDALTRMRGCASNLDQIRPHLGETPLKLGTAVGHNGLRHSLFGPSRSIAPHDHYATVTAERWAESYRRIVVTSEVRRLRLELAI